MPSSNLPRLLDSVLQETCIRLWRLRYSESSVLLSSLTSICRSFRLLLGLDRCAVNIVPCPLLTTRVAERLCAMVDFGLTTDLGAALRVVVGLGFDAVGVRLAGAPGAVNEGVVSVWLASRSLKLKRALAISRPRIRARTCSRPSSCPKLTSRLNLILQTR